MMLAECGRGGVNEDVVVTVEAEVLRGRQRHLGQERFLRHMLSPSSHFDSAALRAGFVLRSSVYPPFLPLRMPSLLHSRPR